MAHTDEQGQTWSTNLTPELVRRLDAWYLAGQKQRADERIALNRESELYAQLNARPGDGKGWHALPMPLHRMEEINRHVANVWRERSEMYPLTCRVITYGGMEWVEWRPFTALTDEEFHSAPQYLTGYDHMAEKGQATPRAMADGLAEAAGRYALLKDVEDAFESLPYRENRWTVHQLGLLIPALENFGTPLDEALRLNLQHQTDGLSVEQRIAKLAETVPALQRLVTWLQTREQAA